MFKRQSTCLFFLVRPLISSTKSFGMRSSEKLRMLHYFGANKSFRIHTYRLASRKSSRMRSYKKGGEGYPTRKRRKFKNRSDSPGSFSQSSDPLTWSVPLPAQGSLPTLAKGSSRSPGKSDAAAR